MRLQERYKQTVYVANETFFGSQEYEEPYPLRFIVTPKSDNVYYAGGTSTEQNNVELKIESKIKGVEKITQNSLIWVRKKPDPLRNNADNTHKVVSRDATTHGWFVTIECKSTKGDAPIV